MSAYNPFEAYLHGKSPPENALGAVSRTEQERLSVSKRLIYGQDIRLNSPPDSVRSNASGLRADFPDSMGRRFSMNETQLSKHLLLLGGIGSGKTNVFNFLLQSMLRCQNRDDIIFIFDTKGDYFDRFHNPRQGHIVIGNGRKYRDITRYWNIFGELEEPGEPFSSVGEFTAKEISKQLFEGRGSDTQPFFNLAAADLVAKILIDMERHADRSSLNNAELLRRMNGADLSAYIDMIRRNEDFSSAMLYFGDPGQNGRQKLTAQALGVFGYINAMRNDLFTGIFAEGHPGREFSMRSLTRSRGQGAYPAVVFIEYDLSAGEVLSPMYRLLIDLALKEALSQDASRRGNVIFFIDEFKLLPNLMHIDDALNFGRSLGVKVFAGLQSIDQVYAIYGEERGRAILSGFMNSFCFQTPDYHSRQYISERFGENCTQMAYRSLNEPMSYQREGHTIEDWDILSLDVGQAAVDLSGEKPFLFQFADFNRQPA